MKIEVNHFPQQCVFFSVTTHGGRLIFVPDISSLIVFLKKSPLFDLWLLVNTLQSVAAFIL